MALIENVRTVLLTGPYGHEYSRETRAFFPPSRNRSIGMVEITLADGTTGLGEGYLAVFAPLIFREIVNFLTPLMIGKESGDVGARVREVRSAIDYWGLQGPARHAAAAFEIALVDANAKRLGVPAYMMLGGARTQALPLYASGGDSSTPTAMKEEFERAVAMGMDLFKIRVRGGFTDVGRTVWALEAGAHYGLHVGVDMSQNLGQPPQSAAEALAYVNAVHRHTPERIAFLEEAVGPMDLDGFRQMRSAGVTRIAGGETITTAEEMCQRIAAGVYDIAQPDAALMGLADTATSINCARVHGCTAAVHAWGGPSSLMANYHAAFAAGGRLAEIPMLHYELRDLMHVEPLPIRNGHLMPPNAPGFGIVLTPEIERAHPFIPEAIYRTPGVLPAEDERAWATKALPQGNAATRDRNW
jgi:L-alanine-DL-glutamate epimerase-like enolase superfamily enzyme